MLLRRYGSRVELSGKLTGKYDKFKVPYHPFHTTSYQNNFIWSAKFHLMFSAQAANNDTLDIVDFSISSFLSIWHEIKSSEQQCRKIWLSQDVDSDEENYQPY